MREIAVGVGIGTALLAVGVPFGLLDTVLQRVVADQGVGVSVTARYEAGDGPDRAALFRGARELPAGVGPETGCAGRAVARGAVDFRVTPVRVQVTGEPGHTVAIEDIRARRTRVGRPGPGVVLACPGQGGAAVPAMALELDDPRPRALRVTEPDGAQVITRTPYFQRTVHYVEDGRPEAFEIAAYARTADCEWVIEVVGSVDGKPHVWTADDGGRPFRTAGELPGGRYRVYPVGPRYAFRERSGLPWLTPPPT
ncbi:hypothetical protein [Streptomyces sp. NPDC089919]|uniref:hypothetical protein n=1 Tax=Streptomyces sp. NPDC089919 TaxID=3155188 RepID=UPI0034434FD8